MVLRMGRQRPAIGFTTVFMRTSPRVALGIAACAVALVGWVCPVYAQQATPTQPKPTPNINELRNRLQQSLSRARQTGASRQGAQPGTGLGQQRQSPGLFGQRGRPDQAPSGPQGRDQPPPKGEAGPPPRGAAGARRTGTRVTIGRGALSAAGSAIQAGVSSALRGGGGIGGAQGVTAVRTVGEAVYDPTLEKEIEYEEVPDEGEPITLNGPIGVGEFLETLALATEWNVLVTETAQQVNLQFWITDTKPKDALEEILKFHDVYYRFDPKTRYLYVMTKEEYLTREFGKVQEHEFVVEHASVDYMESVLTSLLSPNGRIITDPRTLHVYVWDTPANLEKMKETVAELDVPLVKVQFSVQHADLPDIEAILSTMLSPAGSLITDPRTGQILIEDLPAIVDQMRTAMERLDVQLEARVFQLTYVDVDLVIDSIEPLITDRGLIQADPHLNTLVVTDLPSRQDRIAEVIATLDKKLETRTWKIDYLEPDDIAERIEVIVPEEMGDIVVDEDVHQITVTALPERLDEIDVLIEAWDIKRRQVQIEAYLVSVSNDIARSLSIDWSYFDIVGGKPVAYRGGSGATPNYTTLRDTATIGQLPYTEPLRNRVTGEPILNIADEEIIRRFGGSRLAATIDYLDQQGKATVLSAPRVTVQDGEEAVFESGRKVPYVTSTSYGQGYSSQANQPSTTGYNYGYNTYRPYNRIDFIDVGTILKVLPRIAEDDSILLDISAEDSDAEMVQVISSGEENTVPEKTASQAETQVRIQDGQTVVIGGLRKNSTEDNTSSSIPILGDIPLLGRLFRSPSKAVREDTLMIFLTPTIVDEYTQPEAQRLAKVENALAERYRKEWKKPHGRLFGSVTRGKDEIGISVGQSGHMHCSGERATLEELHKRFFAVKVPAAVTVVIRKHPRAPQDVVTAIVESAMEAGLRIEFDERIAPFVPDYGPYAEPPGGGEVSRIPAKDPYKIDEPAQSAEQVGEKSVLTSEKTVEDEAGALEALDATP